MNKSLLALLSIFLLAPLIATCAANAVDTTNPESIVMAFQQFPPYEMFCKDETLDSAEPIKVGAKFAAFLSKEFNKLVLWSQCVEPEVPPHYVEVHAIYWDIRFGFGNGGQTNKVKNIRIQSAKYQGPDKAIVKVLFDPVGFPLKNITTIYTLIREDNHWKIDDIAPKGDWVEEGDQEPFLEHSNSIKTDMQNNYRAAEKRFQQEQVKKH